MQVRTAHVNAGWPADFPGDGARGLSDHDPQVARFASRAQLTVADVTVAEGNKGWTDAVFTATLSRPVGQATTGLCPIETFDGEPLYKPGREPDSAEIARRLSLQFPLYAMISVPADRDGSSSPSRYLSVTCRRC